ncbi:Uncharacterised protein [Morganella morganii]|nr:Uncharacterised protein [Morganella morganii]
MHIQNLINNIKPLIPFSSEQDANNFLKNYTQDDCYALLTAMYIGRDHIHDSVINHNYNSVLSSGSFNRYYHQNTASLNDIPRILYEKNTNLTSYYDSFIRCTMGSNFNLNNF